MTAPPRIAVLVLLLGTLASSVGGSTSSVCREAGDLDACLVLAGEHYRQRQYDEAKTILSDLHARFPDRGEVLYRLGMIELDQDRRARAIDHLIGAVERGFDKAELRLQLGYALFLEARYEAAEHHLARCLDLDSPLELAVRARALLHKTRAAARADAFPAPPSGGGDVVVASDPRAAFLTEARAYYRRGDYEQARRLLDRLDDTGPDDAERLYLAGLIELSTGRLEAAIDPLEDAGSLGTIEAYFYLGFAFVELGDLQSATRCLQHYLAVAGEGRLSERARRLLARIQERKEDRR